MILDPNQTFIDKAQRLSNWGHWFTAFNIVFAMLLSSSFIATDTAPNTIIGYIYLICTWIGHTAFLTFICFVLTIFPISIIFPYPRHIRGAAALFATVGMTLLAIDAYSYSRLGYHISAASFEQVVTLLTTTWHDHPFRSMAWLCGIITAILAIELVLSNYSWKHIEFLKDTNLGKKITILLLSAFISSHCIHIWADANLNYDITKQNNMFPLSYPATAKTLLAKNNLLDKELHQQAKTNQLTLNKTLPFYWPNQQLHCNIEQIDTNLSVIIVRQLPASHIQSLLQQGFIYFSKHYLPKNQDDAIFNLIYGLPILYKNSILSQQQPPLWYDLAKQYQLHIHFDNHSDSVLHPFDYLSQVTGKNPHQIKFIHLNLDKLDSFLLEHPDEKIILVTLPTTNNHQPVIEKIPMLVKWNTLHKYKGQITQNLDINTTIVESWLHCQRNQTKYPVNPITFGKNFTKKLPNLLAANYTAGHLISIKKDKITLLDDQGNRIQFSATNGYQLNQALDLTTIRDTITMLKQFSVLTEDPLLN